VRIIGYATSAGRRTTTVLPGAPEPLQRYLKDHLFDDELVLTDADDRLIFHAVDGVDLYSRLGDLDIDLPALYRRLREAAVSAATPDGGAREPWEDLYDSIGLSPGEITMRQRVKRTAKAARTVADVAELLAGTYFDASFENEDGTREWSGFDPRDLSAAERLPDGGSAEPLYLPPASPVRHRRSSEDVHYFVLLDPPAIRPGGPDLRGGG
jgi:hypothetical protein